MLVLAPCLLIRGYVATYGEGAAIAWAKKHGYSQHQIEKVKRECLRK